MVKELSEQLYDTLSVKIATGEVMAIFAEAETKEDAEAVSNMAAVHRGCDTEFYPVVFHRRYKLGQIY